MKLAKTPLFKWSFGKKPIYGLSCKFRFKDIIASRIIWLFFLNFICQIWNTKCVSHVGYGKIKGMNFANLTKNTVWLGLVSLKFCTKQLFRCPLWHFLGSRPSVSTKRCEVIQILQIRDGGEEGRTIWIYIVDYWHFSST